MIKRQNTFQSSRFKSLEIGEESVNPMETVANLSDVMLVFAVALMLALIAHWGVSVTSGTSSEIEESQLEPINLSEEQVSTMKEEASGSSSYEEIGKVYKDTRTDEYYVVK